MACFWAVCVRIKLTRWCFYRARCSLYITITRRKRSINFVAVARSRSLQFVLVACCPRCWRIFSITPPLFCLPSSGLPSFRVRFNGFYCRFSAFVYCLRSSTLSSLIKTNRLWTTTIARRKAFSSRRVWVSVFAY